MIVPIYSVCRTPAQTPVFWVIRFKIGSITNSLNFTDLLKHNKTREAENKATSNNLMSGTLNVDLWQCSMCEMNTGGAITTRAAMIAFSLFHQHGSNIHIVKDCSNWAKMKIFISYIDMSHQNCKKCVFLSDTHLNPFILHLIPKCLFLYYSFAEWSLFIICITS